jgi:hypothetical protein
LIHTQIIIHQPFCVTQKTPPYPHTAVAPIMLRDMREELRKEKPANMEMAAMPVPVDTTTLHGGKEGRW